MKPTTQEELELQKNRLEILKMSGRASEIETTTADDDNRYLWQYELEFHKNLKKRERFYIIGGICGILSIILTIALHINEILAWF